MIAAQVCTRCVMDTSDPDIVFDDNGICNHCHSYNTRAATELHTGAQGARKLEENIAKIKRERVGEYDCLIGLSGGVDSSYVAYLMKRYDLNPLALHFDNGWNTELAVSNVEQIVKKLGFDYQTFVINWPEFRDLQRAYLLSGVINAEIPTDHAILSIMLKVAAKHNIKYVISGGNLVTEAIMPRSWTFDSRDFVNLKAIHKKYGKSKLSDYPLLSFPKLAYYTLIKRHRIFAILNYVDFNKEQAIEVLKSELGWRPYGGKHYESIFTRFYQSHILLKKFGVDKRRAHLSTLINSSQMTREQALEELALSPCPALMIAEDKEFVAKKLGFSAQEFEEILTASPVSHFDYPNLSWLFLKSPNIMKTIKRVLTV